jgi:hypothetical protein
MIFLICGVIYGKSNLIKLIPVIYKYKYNWVTSKLTAVRGKPWQQYTNPSRQ